MNQSEHDFVENMRIASDVYNAFTREEIERLISVIDAQAAEIARLTQGYQPEPPKRELYAGEVTLLNTISEREANNRPVVREDLSATQHANLQTLLWLRYVRAEIEDGLTTYFMTDAGREKWLALRTAPSAAPAATPLGDRERSILQQAIELEDRLDASLILTDLYEDDYPIAEQMQKRGLLVAKSDEYGFIGWRPSIAGRDAYTLPPAPARAADDAAKAALRGHTFGKPKAAKRVKLTDLELSTLKFVIETEQRKNDEHWRINGQGQIGLYGKQSRTAKRLVKKGLVTEGRVQHYSSTDAGRAALKASER